MSTRKEGLRDRVVRSVLKSVEQLNARQYDDYLADFAESFTFRADFLPHPLDRKQALQYMKEFVRMFPGVRLTVEEIFTDVDATSLVYRFTAKADGTEGFMGLPPTREPIEFHGATFYKLENGLRVDSWNIWDNASILQQMGDLSGVSPAGGQDSRRPPAAARVPGQELLPTPIRDSSVYRGETLVLGYAFETARVHRGSAGIYLTSDAETFNLDGRSVGRYRGALGVADSLDPRQLSESPPMPPPLGRGAPRHFPEVPIIGHLLVEFRFGDRDSVTVVGTGTGRLTSLARGSSFFMISAMGLVAGGTGRYRETTGIANLSGITSIDGELALTPGTVFDFKTFFTLHLAPRARRSSAGGTGGVPKSTPSSAPTGQASMAAGGGDLARVERQLRRVANFTFFSMPNAEQPNVPIKSGGELIGVEVHENLHRFEIGQKVTSSGFDIYNAVGQPTAQVHMHWRPIPDDFVARPGVEIPPTALDPSRSQRFMMHDGHFSLDDSGGSGLRGFGSGRTFPVLVNGQRQLRLAAVVDVLEGLGEVAGHQGLLVVNGYIEPPDGLALCILLRLTDPSSDFAARSRLPALRPLPDPDPDNLYLIFLGEPVPGEPVEMLHGPDGQMLGARGPQRMRLIDVVYDIEGNAGIRSKTAVGEIVGEMNADAWFDPFSGAPPYPFQTTGGTFTFFGRDRKTVGAVAADMVEGRALPTAMPGAPMPVFRVGGMAPVTRGSGCFQDAVGIFTIDSFISLVPNTVSGLFVLHLSDPGGKLRKALADAWR